MFIANRLHTMCLDMNQFPVIFIRYDQSLRPLTSDLNPVADQQWKLCEEKKVLSLRALPPQYRAVGNCPVQSCIYIAQCTRINLALHTHNSVYFCTFCTVLELNF